MMSNLPSSTSTFVSSRSTLASIRSSRSSTMSSRASNCRVHRRSPSAIRYGRVHRASTP